MKYLKLSKFKTVVKNTPLVAVDFLIVNSKNEVLLGKRRTNPAKGLWCVPGGRILKNESIKQAVKRKLFEEIGLKKIPRLSFLGVYEHFYKNSAVDDNVSTHYISIGFKFKIDNIEAVKLNDQHEKLIFVKKEKLLKSRSVPKYIKNYFLKDFTDLLGVNK